MSAPRKAETLRIVSLAPSVTSILCAIGAKDCLVGVTPWCPDVAPVNRLPKVGDCWRLDSVTEIVKLKPTLVIGSVPFKAETLAKLLDHPLNFLAQNPRTLAEIERDIRLLGGIAGRRAQAARLVAKMRAEFTAVEKESRNVARQLRVYCEAWPNPRISSPPWVAELVNLCGCKMVVTPGQRVSDEQVAAAHPDVIIVAWTATGDQAKFEKAYKVDAWRDLPAIRNRCVFVVRDELLNTPGPPLMQGAKELLRLLQRAAAAENYK
ncbi:MAG TPA: ABC transporter substrate-binding protein [Candidatus Acidoferrum sp.]|nr:ABC transporter substrate-binding protein [Candidatus Acidoferrum sp.]